MQKGRTLLAPHRKGKQFEIRGSWMTRCPDPASVNLTHFKLLHIVVVSDEISGRLNLSAKRNRSDWSKRPRGKVKDEERGACDL